MKTSQENGENKPIYPIMELRGENEVWIYVPEKRTDINIILDGKLYRIQLPETPSKK